MLDNDYSDNSTVTVRSNRSGHSFEVHFRGTQTVNSMVFLTEEAAMQAGTRMLAQMETEYLRTMQAFRRP